MTDTTDLHDPVAVVYEADALDAAYRLGTEKGPANESPPDAYSHFTETAQYANVVAPMLRCLAGHGDAGHGTYRVRRPVVVVPEGDGDDSPAVGEYHDSPDPVLNVVLDAFRRGFHDAHRTDPEGYDDLSLV